MKQIMGLHSKNTGKWWGCSLMAYGAWVRCHSPLFPFPAITDSSLPLYSHPPRPELPGGNRLLILCLPWAPLPAGWHGLCRAGSTGSLLCGRLKPAACICLSSAYSVETSTVWFIMWDYSRPHSFRSQLIPFAQAYPPATFPQSLHLWIKVHGRSYRISPLMLTPPL